jgi:hypothetical protein
MIADKPDGLPKGNRDLFTNAIQSFHINISSQLSFFSGLGNGVLYFDLHSFT